MLRKNNQAALSAKTLGQGPKQFKKEDYERPGVLADEVQQIKDSFDLFTPDAKGCINPRELIASLEALGTEVQSQPIYIMIMEQVQKGVTSLNFQQFLDLMTARVSSRDTREMISKIFAMFDEEHTGFITLKSLKQVMRELGENVEEAQLREMIEKADSDNDGQVSEEDFYMVMTKKHLRQI